MKLQVPLFFEQELDIGIRKGKSGDDSLFVLGDAEAAHYLIFMVLLLFFQNFINSSHVYFSYDDVGAYNQLLKCDVALCIYEISLLLVSFDENFQVVFTHGEQHVFVEEGLLFRI